MERDWTDLIPATVRRLIRKNSLCLCVCVCLWRSKEHLDLISPENSF